MRILVKPSDIVKRCMWDSYTYYILGSEKDAEKILTEDKEFEMSERDALVMGLLKTIETPNLIHKFNDYIIHTLTNKSVKNANDLLIKRKSIETAIEKFYEKFPDYWVPGDSWTNSLTDMYKYIEEVKSGIDKLEITKLTDKYGTYEFYSTNSIKKLLNFNNY